MKTIKVLRAMLFLTFIIIASANGMDKDAVLETLLTAQANNVASLNTMEFKATLYSGAEMPLGERRTVTGPKSGGAMGVIFDEEIVADERISLIDAYVKGNKIRVDEFVTTATLTLKNGKRVENQHIVRNTKMVCLEDKALYRETGKVPMTAWHKREFFTGDTIYGDLFPPGLEYKTGISPLGLNETLEVMKNTTTEIDVKQISGLITITRQIQQYGIESMNSVTLDVHKGMLPILAEAWMIVNGEKRPMSHLEQELLNCQGIWVAVNRTSTYYAYSKSGELLHKSTARVSLDRNSIRINQEISDKVFTLEGLGTTPTEMLVDYTVDPPVTYNVAP